MQEYGISARLTFSNSLLKEKHLSDRKCNALCALLEENKDVQNGVIVHSDLLLEYLKKHYPHLYFVSSTTKVITDFKQLVEEIRREDFRYVVPDFRLNKAYDRWKTLSWQEKDKVEFLCNECCWFGCKDRRNNNRINRRIQEQSPIYTECRLCHSFYNSSRKSVLHDSYSTRIK